MDEIYRDERDMFSALNLHTVQLGLNYRHKYQYYKLDITKLTIWVYTSFKEEEIFCWGWELS